jgi:hypothetical protein
LEKHPEYIGEEKYQICFVFDIKKLKSTERCSTKKATRLKNGKNPKSVFLKFITNHQINKKN